MRDVAYWHLTSFRCRAAIWSFSERSGHRANLTKHDLGMLEFLGGTLNGCRPIWRYNVSNALAFASMNHRLRNKRNSPPQIAKMDHSTWYMRTASSPFILFSIPERAVNRSARLPYIMPCIVPCTRLCARQQARQNSFHHSVPSCHIVRLVSVLVSRYPIGSSRSL